MTTDQFISVSLTCRITDSDAFDAACFNSGVDDKSDVGLILEFLMLKYAQDPIPGLEVFAGGAGRIYGGRRYMPEDCVFGDHSSYMAMGTHGECMVCGWTPSFVSEPF